VPRGPTKAHANPAHHPHLSCPHEIRLPEDVGGPPAHHRFRCPALRTLHEDVHFCRTDEETLRHARAGHCIAREEPHPDELPYLMLGRPAIPPVVTPEQEQARALRAREGGITAALDNARYEGARDCPECGYPVPSFRKTCYVCAFELGRG
jgi:hypothetical protein